MLSLLPNLLNWWIFAPIILRAALGISFLSEASRERQSKKPLTTIKLILGIGLILGLFTQVVALASAILVLYRLVKKQDDRELLILELAISLALLVLGPGIFAIDLPL